MCLLRLVCSCAICAFFMRDALVEFGDRVLDELRHEVLVDPGADELAYRCEVGLALAAVAESLRELFDGGVRNGRQMLLGALREMRAS